MGGGGGGGPAGILSRFRGLFTVGASNITASAASSLFWLFMAGVLGGEGYGEFSYLMAIAQIAAMISVFGAGKTVVVHRAKEGGTEPAFFYFGVASASAVSVASFLVTQNAAIGAFVAGHVVFSIISSEFLGGNNFGRVAALQLSTRLAQIAMSVGFYHLLGIDGLILGYALAYLIALPPFLKAMLSGRPGGRALRDRFGFMLHGLALSGSRRLSLSLDKLIIMPLYGFLLLGNYQLGIQIFIIMSLIPMSVFQFTLPHDARGKPHTGLKIATVLASGAVCAASVVLAPAVLPALFPGFGDTVEVVQILSMAIIPLSVETMYSSKFFGTEQTRHILVGAVIFLSIQVTMIVALGGVLGAAGLGYAFLLGYVAKAAYFVAADRAGGPGGRRAGSAASRDPNPPRPPPPDALL